MLHRCVKPNLMDPSDQCRVLDQIPVLHVRGTHYEIGLSVVRMTTPSDYIKLGFHLLPQGRSFTSMHQDIFENWDFFNNVIMLNYNTDKGKQIYNDSLRLCETKFPLYVEELRGVADGSGVPFHKIFLAHLDCLMTAAEEDTKNKQIQADSGCTSVLCNDAETLVAQNEDAFPEHANHIYIVVAEIVDKSGNRLESFAALCYPGMLPGLAMSFNYQGLVFTVNTLVPKEILDYGTPRFFITRALLTASNHDEVMEILLDKGTGIGDGFSANICYINREKPSSRPTMYNIEVAPPKKVNGNSESLSQVSARCVPPGEIYVHCNKYLHLLVPEHEELLISSINRHEAISKLPSPFTVERIKNVLSDQSKVDYPVYRRCQTVGMDGARTVATGIFDIQKLEWSIYVNMPTKSDATVVIPMNL